MTKSSSGWPYKAACCIELENCDGNLDVTIAVVDGISPALGTCKNRVEVCQTGTNKIHLIFVFEIA